MRLHVTVERGVRGILCDRLRRSDGAPWVPRLPRSSSPLLVTPICVVGGAPRAVLCPFPVRRLVVGLADPVTGRWSFECNLKESNSVIDYTLKYRRHIQPGR